MEQKNEICLEGVKPDNLKMLTEISFSKEIRRLQDKTQMFNTRISEHFRTRLTHTMEVASIAERIVEKLAPVLEKKEIYLDSNLVKAIAYAHDIGHTPFGHIGEEKINDLLINDCLYFKHNIHSAKILLDPRIIKTNESNNVNENVERFGFNYPNYDWRLFDGVIKHTNAYPKQAKTDVKNDPYNLYVYFSNHPLLKNEDFQKFINDFVVKYKGLYCENTELMKLNSFIDNYLNYPAALSLEGQIVAIADEISQRISDFDDAIRLYYKSNYAAKYTNAFEELCEDLEGYKKCLNEIKKDITLTTKENTSRGHNRDVKRKINKRINIKYKTKSKINLQISNYDICNYDGEKTSQFLGSTANYCDVIVKNIRKILECSSSPDSSNFSNRIVYQYRISKKLLKN